MSVILSGSGLWTPEHCITNEELVDAYNQYAARFNQQNEVAIHAGDMAPMPFSSADFIVKASGIKQRYLYEKDGVLDIDRMRPKLAARADHELSHQAQMGVAAAQQALDDAQLTAADIDAVIVACAYTQRAYPAISIEIQHHLGIKGFAFDMLVACSAATFGLHRAFDMVKSESARHVLVINPELTSPQVNYTDRDSHFIFGDVATAAVVSASNAVPENQGFRILSTRAKTDYSNNIRSNFSYISRATDESPFADDALFHQEGRRVFKEVCPMAAEHIQRHIGDHGLAPGQIRRWWLHQANINMNQLIVKKLLDCDTIPQDIAPIVLDEYANTASAGSMIAFARYHHDFTAGDWGLICSFGAGYSIGSLLLQKA